MAPVGYEELTAGKRIKTFFEGYLAAPIVVLMYVGFKFIKKTKIVRAKDMDVTSRIRGALGGRTSGNGQLACVEEGLQDDLLNWYS
jgi:amino acid permease